MKIAKKKLINILKEEIEKILEQEKKAQPVRRAASKTSTGRAFPKNQENLQNLTDRLNSIFNKIQDGPKKRKMFKIQRQLIKKMGYGEKFLNQMIGVAQSYADDKDNQNANSVKAIIQNVTNRFKRADPNAIKKIIELQAMLVKLKVAPAKLKNGKPFVDGFFGRSTIAAISKLYR